MSAAQVLTAPAETAGAQAAGQTFTLIQGGGGSAAAGAGAAEGTAVAAGAAGAAEGSAVAVGVAGAAEGTAVAAGALTAGEVVGAIALGAAVGLGVGLAIIGIAALAIYLAKDNAPGPPKAVQDCPPDEVPCFNRPPDMDKDEFARQLKEQQDALNKMSPDDYLKARQSYSPSNRDREAQRTARESYEAKKSVEYYDENMANGMDPEAAQKAAEARVADEMSHLDATHVLDMIAGGDPSAISGLGDRSVNRSIGSQWKDRVDKLDEIAEKAKKEGKDKMNVELKACD
jgi:hypothetical protein